MIKKLVIVLTLCCLIFTSTAKAEVFQYVGSDFDWLILNQQEKTERISNIFRLLFPDGKITNYTRKEIRTMFKPYLKDNNNKIHYDAMVAGYRNYRNVILQPYYYKNTDCIYMYALQYKKDLSKTYYYSVLGKLKFVDLRFGDLENCPCYIKKYGMNGKLKRAAYVQNSDIIYNFNEKGEFENLEYKSTLYTH